LGTIVSMGSAPALEELPGRLESELAKVLSPNETVTLKLKGAFNEGLICTDRRVLILKGGFMAGQLLGNDVFQQPYGNIAGVQVVYHLASGYFELSAGGMANTRKSYWSNDRKNDPAKAPNCVSLNSKKQAGSSGRRARTFWSRSTQFIGTGPTLQLRLHPRRPSRNRLSSSLGSGTREYCRPQTSRRRRQSC
jgi:hypothetical protein